MKAIVISVGLYIFVVLSSCCLHEAAQYVAQALLILFKNRFDIWAGDYIYMGNPEEIFKNVFAVTTVILAWVVVSYSLLKKSSTYADETILDQY